MVDENDYFKYREFLPVVSRHDVAFISVKDHSYRGSWKRGGGRSAWFMMRRKLDRLLALMEPPAPPPGWPTAVAVGVDNTNALLRLTQSEDIFAMITARPGGEDGTVLAEVRDLRRYLMLVEAEMVARGVVEVDSDSAPEQRSTGVGPGTPEDGGHHARQEGKEELATSIYQLCRVEMLKVSRQRQLVFKNMGTYLFSGADIYALKRGLKVTVGNMTFVPPYGTSGEGD